MEADAAKGPDAPAVLRDAGPPNLLGDSSFTGSACGTAWTVVNSVATVSMVVPDGAPHGLSSCMVCNETDAEPIALAHFEYEPQLPVDASLGYSGTADLLILSDGGVHGPALNVGIGMCSSMDQFRQDAGWVLHRSTTVPCDAGKLTWAVTAMLKPGACFLVYDPTLTASP